MRENENREKRTLLSSTLPKANLPKAKRKNVIGFGSKRARSYKDDEEEKRVQHFR
jgi:hypothetical protein